MLQIENICAGTIPKEWTRARLKHYVRFVGGATPSTENPAYWNGDIPWVSPKDMKTSNIADTEDHLSEQGLASCSSSKIPLGSILIVVRSGILQHTLPVAVNTRIVALNQDMKALVPHGGLIASFLRYILLAGHPGTLESLRKQGATVESIDQQLLENLIIPIPPCERQKEIANFLDQETAEADALVAKYERAIALVKERRSALITAAVTGAIDVTADRFMQNKAEVSV